MLQSIKLQISSLHRAKRALVGINICAITAAIKKYQSIIKKKKKKHDKIVLLGKCKLNIIEVKY